MATVLGSSRVYHTKFKFTVQIDGVLVGSFQSCSELASEYAEIQQWEGGAVIPYKGPGRITYDDVTLARGVTGVTELYDWWRTVGDLEPSSISGAIQAGVSTIVNNATAGAVTLSPFKRNVEIWQYDRTSVPVRKWHLFGAWPKRFVAGDWDNDADENVIEQIVLAYDFFDLSFQI